MVIGAVNRMKYSTLSVLLLVVGASANVQAQAETQINDVTLDASGRIQLKVGSSSEHYYVLYRRLSADDDAEQAVSLTLGEEGSTTLTEPLGAHGPDELYRVVHSTDKTIPRIPMETASTI